MKLYTEEQVMLLLDLAKLKINGQCYSKETLLEQVAPIEIPSDEEIEDKGKWVFNNAGHTIYTHYNTVPSWIEGAKWVIEQIKQQDK